MTKAKDLIVPAIGGFGGIVVSDMVGDWVEGSTSISESIVGQWGRVISSFAIGLGGLVFIKGSADLRTGALAFAGASFGEGLTQAFAIWGIF